MAAVSQEQLVHLHTCGCACGSGSNCDGNSSGLTDTHTHIHTHVACWQKAYSDRPSFTEILSTLKDIEREEFMTTTSLDDFLSIQSIWRSEIKEKFLKFKTEEIVS